MGAQNTHDVVLLILAICGGIVTLVGALEKIISAGRILGSPYAEHTRRITALEARCDKYDRYFDSDKQRIQDLEQALSIIIQSQFAILSHLCGGDKGETEQLKAAQTELQKYLTLRGIKV